VLYHVNRRSRIPSGRANSQMSTLIHLLPFIPLAVFFVCCGAQLPALEKMAGALRRRHPAEWAELNVSFLPWVPLGREWKFMLSGRHRELNDLDLTRKVGEAQRVILIGFGALAMAMACIDVIWS